MDRNWEKQKANEPEGDCLLAITNPFNEREREKSKWQVVQITTSGYRRLN